MGRLRKTYKFSVLLAGSFLIFTSFRFATPATSSNSNQWSPPSRSQPQDTSPNQDGSLCIFACGSICSLLLSSFPCSLPLPSFAQLGGHKTASTDQPSNQPAKRATTTGRTPTGAFFGCLCNRGGKMQKSWHAQIEINYKLYFISYPIRETKQLSSHRICTDMRSILCKFC